MANRKKWITCGGRCISVCPWNKPMNPFHNMVRLVAIHSPARVKKILVRADILLYGRTRKIGGSDALQLFGQKAS
jgi:hypothetical protein